MARPEKYVIPKLDPPEVFYWGPEIDRQTARDIGHSRYFTGKPCRKGHVAERWVSSLTCIECVLRRHRTPEYLDDAVRWNADNRERHGETFNANRRAKRHG